MRINLISFSFRKIHSRSISSLVKYFTVMPHRLQLHCPPPCLHLPLVQKIAPFSKTTISFVEVCPTFLRLVLRVCCVVFLQLVRTVRELALPLVRTVPEFHELSTEFRFFLVVGVFRNVPGGGGAGGRDRVVLVLRVEINVVEFPFNSSAEHPLQTIYL